MKECGIDEAGRGPVIGPLCIAGVLIDEKDLPKLKAINVKDSKLIQNHHMERYAKKILDIIEDHKIIVIQPQEIDAALNNPNLNLNWLEAIKAAEIINTLKADRVIVDSPSNNLSAFQAYLENLFQYKPKEVRCEHKADANYLSVAAASILAKDAREKEVKKLKEFIGIDFGSGYPADPKTQKFIKDYHAQFPEIFRQTWQTYKDVLAGKKQKKLDDFE